MFLSFSNFLFSFSISPILDYDDTLGYFVVFLAIEQEPGDELAQRSRENGHEHDEQYSWQLEAELLYSLRLHFN